MKRVIKIVLLIPKQITKFFKKSKDYTFIGGLIFGALFSLLVNIVTIQIQEAIQKQRILESLENEIVSNAIQSNYIINNNNSRIIDKEKPNYFIPIQDYSNNVWNTSEALKYTSQLDSDVQAKIITYYSITIRGNNYMIGKDRELADNKLSDCYFDFDNTLTKQQSDFCLSLYEQILQNEISSAAQVGKNSFDLLNSFHPTQDRLNNPLLRLLMGNKSTRILSGG